MGLRATGVRPRRGRGVAVATGWVLALALAIGGLSACRTNVGTAADIDGHRVSESDVAKYVTGSSKAIPGSNGSAAIAPKSFVIEVLIDQRLYPKLLKAAKLGSPTTGQLSTLRRQLLAGHSVKDTVERLGVHGYSSRFSNVVLDVQVLGTLLNQAQQQGSDLSSVARALHFPVTVNPRYGIWRKQNLALDTASTAGVPGFLKLQGSPAAQP